MESSPRILFVTNAGPEVGGGHVMRSLTLAEALMARGARPAYWAWSEITPILDRFAAPGIERVADCCAEGFDAVVFDTYDIDGEGHRRIAGGRPTLLIDDLPNRLMAVDIVLDPSPNRRPEDYAPVLPQGARVLAGPDYALVRPPFRERREAALARRRTKPEVKVVHVSMGLTDVGAITRRVVDRVLPRLGEARLDVVLGHIAPSREAIERLAARDGRVRPLIEVKTMPDLMAEADVAVGAGGSSTWERSVVGLPTVLMALAENQEPSSRALERLGAAEFVDLSAPDFDASFDRAFTGLMRSADRRLRLTEAAARVCDGLGAERVADIFLELIASRRR